MIYEKHLQEKWFNLIKFGQKTVEGRLLKSDFANMVVGDIIQFHNKPDKSDAFKVIIKKITIHKTFKEMIIKNRLKNVLPTINRINEGVEVYHKIYSKEDEKKYKVVAIHFELL